MSNDSYHERWSKEFKHIRKKILPWQRYKLPKAGKEITEEYVIEYLKVAKPLIEQGKFWYTLMTPVRFILKPSRVLLIVILLDMLLILIVTTLILL